MGLGSSVRGSPRAFAAVAFGTGCIAGGGAILAYRWKARPEAPSTASYEKKIRKLQKVAQERIHWKGLDSEVLGLSPRLWMEVLDPKHRYAGLLYDYWRRWELSDTQVDFLPWLLEGQGAWIDLPTAPRRLLSEWEVLYLTREQQPACRVEISPDGKFLWEFDGSPVTAPDCKVIERILAGNSGQEMYNLTERERAESAAFVFPGLARAMRRDRLLAEARAQVNKAEEGGEPPVMQRLEEIAAPLVQEGMLCQLRDPYYHERLEAALTPDGHAHLWNMERLPDKLLPGLSWADVTKALDHEEGFFMKAALPAGDFRSQDNKGIFVLDAYGRLYCGTKFRGMFQHSSFTRGHCVRVAGIIKIKDGQLLEVAPHSGHYQPSQEQFDRMIDEWKAKGVDFTHVLIKPYIKFK